MILLSVFSDDPLDPGHHLRDPGVDPRVLGLGTPDSPAHDADLLTGAAVGAVKQRTTGVSLKRSNFQCFYNFKSFFSFCFIQKQTST